MTNNKKNKPNKKPAKKIVKKNQVFNSTISKTLGVALGVLIIIFGLAVLIYLSIVIHDKFLSSQYENPPSYSKDNQWGGLAVNVVIDKKEIKEPIAPKPQDCSSVYRNPFREFESKFNLPASTCVPGQLVGGFDGSVYLEGTINVKNNLWLETKIIPTNLLTFNHGGRQVKPKLEKNIFGQYLNHGQGTSTKFTFAESYDAKDFQLYLNDGTKSALIVGDTIEPEHK